MSQSIHPGLLTPFGWENRFEVQERIGGGSMGQVWRALEKETGRIVALKLLDSSRTGDEQTIARLEIEGETLTRLGAAGVHENIVPIYDFKVTDSHACLIMEFIPGMNLKKWCESQRLDLTARVRLMVQVAHASGWFHQLGVVHRDIKPANILVSALTHQPVIVDFSIAKVRDSLALTLTNEALGTTPYMAPEQFDRRCAEISPATDVYALGATLYELLTRVHPHPGEFAQVMQRHAEEVRPARPSLLNPAIPHDLECICLKALAHFPAGRYMTGSEMAADLDSFLLGKPVSARPISRLNHLARQARRRPALSFSLVACVILFFILAWDRHESAAMRHEHEIEAGVIKLLQEKSWTRESLQQADAWVAELAIHRKSKSEELKGAVVHDMIHDIENALLQRYITPDDILWMRGHALRWLQAHDSFQGERLAGLLDERLRRWKPLVVLKPPFEDHERIFGPTRMRIEGGLIFPAETSMPDAAPIVRLSLAPRQPVQLNATFSAPIAKAGNLSLAFEFQKMRTVVQLVSPEVASETMLELLSEKSIRPEGVILAIVRQGNVEACRYIEQDKGSDTRFTLSVTIQGNQIDAAINGHPGLHVEDLFAFASSNADNHISISWPSGIGMGELGVLTREQETSNEIEAGDMLYQQGQWSAAQWVYENCRGMPDTATEASYKTAVCLWKQDISTPALAAWQHLSEGPPSLWRDLSILHLWAHAATTAGVAAARPFLERVPENHALWVVFSSLLAKDDRKQIAKIYEHVAQSSNSLRLNFADVNDAIKAYKIARISPVETAAKLALAQHFNGMDKAAFNMFATSLGNPMLFVDNVAEQRSAQMALDHWTRMVPTDRDVTLHRLLKAWRKSCANDAGIQCVGLQDDARIYARDGKLEKALGFLLRFKEGEQVSPGLRSSTALLEGVIHHDLGHQKEARLASQKGVVAALEVTTRHGGYLGDLLALHTLGRSWSRDVCTQVIAKMTTPGRMTTEELGLHSAFVSTSITHPDLAHSLNALMDTVRGQEIVRAQALRTRPARELIRRWYALLIECFFSSHILVDNADIASQARIQDTAARVVDLLVSGRGNSQDMRSYLEAWNDPAAGSGLFDKTCSYSPVLTNNLRWLLSLSHGETRFGSQ